MRHQPIGIDAIAGKTAAQMIINTALTDFARRHQNRCAHIRVAGQLSFLPNELIKERLRKFRRTGQPALGAVNMLSQCARGALRQIGRHVTTRIGRRFGAQALRQCFGVGFDLIGCFGPNARNFSEDLHKAGPPILRGFGEICAAPKGRAIGVEANGQGPAALLAHHGQRAHINLIKVGALFAVKLDADEIGVHQRRHFFVFKAFMRHHVTPMTRRITNG